MIESGNYLKIKDEYKFSRSMMDGAGANGSSLIALKSGSSGQVLNSSERFPCSVCGKSYLRKRHLQRHMRDECIGIPPRFSCDLCPSRFRRKYHMVRHLTSKHGIPPSIAQQTTGSSNRHTSSNLVKDELEGPGNLTMNHVNNLGGCDNGLPENLTVRKENSEQKPPQQLQQHHQHYLHHQQVNVDSASPSHVTSGDSGSDCNGGGTAGTSPVPPTHVIPIPTYGLTGAITAISAAAAHVEEKDAKILLEAAAAAAQAAANNNLQQTLSDHASVNIMIPGHNEDTENVAENRTPSNTGPLNAVAVKTEPLTPTKAAEAATANTHALDDEWKMKLSLQLISNSLLKERLMNTMPFAYKNN